MTRLLITGGTGSFGNAMLKRMLLRSDLKEIRIFSRDEKKQDDMKNLYDDPRITYVIGDVRNRASVDAVMKDIDAVFHAAAMKQVPSCEEHPEEAFATNVLGSANVINAAVEAGVDNLVLLSTDKAVMPVNTMGMTKALMEKLGLAAAKKAGGYGTTICITRYGNVMGSRGSVIPKFAQQIKDDKTVTVTNPEMTRFMMTLLEAVELVDYALEYGENGSTYVYNAPASTVISMACAVMELVSDKPCVTTDDKWAFEVVGERPGEKIHETLITPEEGQRCMSCIDSRWVEIPLTDNFIGSHLLEFPEGLTSENTKRLSDEETIRLIEKAGIL